MDSKIIEAIQNQIDAVAPIMRRIISLQAAPVRPQYGTTVLTGGKIHYNKTTVELIEEQIDEWQIMTKAVLAGCFGSNSEHKLAFERTIVEHRMYYDAKKELQQELKDGCNALSAIIDEETVRDNVTSTQCSEHHTIKPPKIFISHKKEDEAYAKALVNLINFVVGADGDKLFCSSVPGYGIKQSRDIMDDMKAQFDNHNIFMIIIHSPRYYQSAICLNEMGASWALGTKFASFMTKDCEYKHMRGVINKEKICINLNDEAGMLNAHLNDFKNDLLSHFGFGAIDENKWENARQQFVDAVTALTYSTTNAVSRSEVDLFDTWYLPAFHHIFELLDLEHFQNWTYPCAIAGNTILKAHIYENLNKVPNYIMSRPKHQQYAPFDALLRNLGMLVDDFETVYSQHAEKFGDDEYVVERFYKRIQNNPYYERDLEAYTEHVRLVSDMLFELARLCNLLLSRIREIYPEYRQDLGVLHIDTRISAPDLVYRESEISDTPYPGLKEYIKVRMTRETHLGSNPSIDESGYER